MNRKIYCNSIIGIDTLQKSGILADYELQSIQYTQKRKERLMEYTKNTCVNSSNENVVNVVIASGNKVLNSYNVDDFIKEISGKNHKIISTAKICGKIFTSETRIKMKHFSGLDIKNITLFLNKNTVIDPLITLKMGRYIDKIVTHRGFDGLPIKKIYYNLDANYN